MYKFLGLVIIYYSLKCKRTIHSFPDLMKLETANAVKTVYGGLLNSENLIECGEKDGGQVDSCEAVETWSALGGYRGG